MKFVFNEWFLDWHLPNAASEEKRKVRRIFEWLLASEEHQIVVLSQSPFIKKLNDFRKAHNSGFTGGALKEFISGVVLAKEKCLLLETSPDLPDDILNRLSVGNFSSDRYLFQSAEATEDKIIVTTDAKLIKHFEENSRYQLWSVEEFMTKFEIR